MSIQIGRRGSAEVLSSSDVQGIISGQSGWQVFVDSLHTVGSPQTITAGATAILSNNASLVIASQLPLDASNAFWNASTNKFIPITLDDYYSWIVRFKAKNSLTNGGYMNVGIDIGGTFNTIFSSSLAFIRGSGVEQSFNIAMSGYSGATFLANGGLPKLTSVNGITTVYEKEYHIVRHHKGRP